MEHEYVSFGSGFSKAVEIGGFWAILGMGLGLVLLVVILAFKARFAAVSLLAFAMCFSLSTGALGDIAVMVRWFALICLLPLSIQGLRRQGPAVILLWVYAFLSTLCCVWSVSPMWAFQKSLGLLLLVIGLPGVVQILLDKGAKYETFFVGIIILACLWAILNVLPLGVHLSYPDAARFKGGATSPGYNALVMGIMMPFCLWGIFRKWSLFFKVFCTAILLLLIVVLMFGATRGGAFMGLIACIPLILKFSMKRIVTASLYIGLVVMLCYAAFNLAGSSQQAFVIRRYSGESGDSALTGRGWLWEAGLEACRENIWLGEGAGSASIYGNAYLDGHGFHNSYLIIWHSSGIFGALAFLFATIISLHKGWWILLMARGTNNPETQLIARVLFGLVLGMSVLGMVEGTLSSSTNFIIGMYVLIIVLINDLYRQLKVPTSYLEKDVYDSCQLV